MATDIIFELDSFKKIIQKLESEIAYERENNPDDCNDVSWGSQIGILISVTEAEQLVAMNKKPLRGFVERAFERFFEWHKNSGYVSIKPEDFKEWFDMHQSTNKQIS